MQTSQATSLVCIDERRRQLRLFGIGTVPQKRLDHRLMGYIIITHLCSIQRNVHMRKHIVQEQIHGLHSRISRLHVKHGVDQVDRVLSVSVTHNRQQVIFDLVAILHAGLRR